jgi:hypothetical protein
MAIDPSQVQWDDESPTAAADTSAPKIDASQVKWDDDEQPSSTPFQDAWGAVKHQGAQLVKAGANAVAALPLMAMDAGVGARNLFGKVTGVGGTDYEYPSQTWHEGMNQIFGAPQNAVEKVNDVVLPMMLGAASASSEAPSAIRAMMAGPAAAEQAPANFVRPADAQKQVLSQTIKKGQDLGMVMPPQTTNPGPLNATVETIGGKIQTAQGASIHNQPIANAVAAKELGLNPDAPLTPGAVKSVISDAGKGYEALRNVGQITTDQPYLDTLADVSSKAAGPAASFPGSAPSPLIKEADTMLQPSFDASHAVDKIAQLRDASSMAYRNGDTQVGAGYRRLSNALEDQIDRGISQNPDISPSTVANFRASRQLAAKAHSVLDALNPSTGDVSIHSLASSEDPLSGGLKTLADFGRAAPKATQDVAKIGSHGVSHLDTLGTMLAGGLGEHAAGPAGIALGAAYPAARWGARAYALGPGQSAALPKIATGAGSPKIAGAAVQALEQGDSIQRARGGKVDIDTLVNRLIKRWHEAKRATDSHTKALLKEPDSVIVKALNVAQEHI